MIHVISGGQIFSTYERGYLRMIKKVIDTGAFVNDRTGVGSYQLFNMATAFDLSGGDFPIFTHRPIGFRLAFEEWMFFMRGETQTKALEAKGINFWNGNTTRQFLDARGLTHLPEGDMGKAYGYQFRNYQDSVDQLYQVWNDLNKNPYGRRHVVTFWNPDQLDEMALPPCWFQHIFYVDPPKVGGNGSPTLNMKVHNRSLDILFGFPYALVQYAFYQTAMAKSLGMNVGIIATDHTNVHVYKNQVEYAMEAVERDVYEAAPTLTITKELNSLDDILSLEYSDIELSQVIVNKSPFINPRPLMAV